MVTDKTYIVKYILSLFFLLFLAAPLSVSYAQDVDEEGEMFWGEEEEEEDTEYEEDEEYMEDEEEEYEEDEEEYEEDEEGDEDYYEGDEEDEEIDYEEEDDYDSEDVGLADEACLLYTSDAADE